MKNKIPKIKLRLINNKDLKFTYQLYNNNVLEKKFFSKKPVTFEEHKNWFKEKLKEKFFFICLEKKKIGYVRFEKITKKNLSVSIAVDKKYLRKGYGKLMLLKSLNKKRISKYNIYAFVKKNNSISKKFFLNSGFKFVKNNRYMIKARA